MIGPFRIERSIGALGADTPAQNVKAYMGRLQKLIPSEVVGMYLTIRGFLVAGLTSKEILEDVVVNAWILCCLALVVFVRAWGTRDINGSGNSIQWRGVAISSVAFVVWVLAMGHSLPWLGTMDDRIPPMLAAVFTFIVPYFYKGSPSTRPKSNPPPTPPKPNHQ